METSFNLINLRMSTLSKRTGTKVITAMFVLLLSLLSLTSCNKNDTSINEPKYGGTLTGMVNGEIIAVSEIGFYVYSGQVELKSKGFNPFTFSTINGIAQTTYDIKSGNGTFFTYDNGKFYGLFSSSKQGEFVITKIDEVNKTMSGTFQATLYSSSALTDKVTVSNGVFENVPYVVEKEHSGNIYIAKVDGTELKGALGPRGGGSAFMVEYTTTYKGISLTFPLTVAPVTYDVAKFVDPTLGVKYFDGIYSYKATSGNITVTSIDTASKKIEGTYSVVVESIPVAGVSKQITEGVFSFTYP